MSCYHPIPAYRTPDGNSIKFWPAAGHSDQFCVPCGRCVGCRLERARQWAVRLVHEGQHWDSKCFITLTYDDEHLPPFGTLVLRDFQLFMKRLRRACNGRISFFHCGEYGDENLRPHYHAIIFGFSPADKIFGGSSGGVDWYISEFLSALWRLGFVSVGDVTFESCAYVARYCLKKRSTGLTVDACPSHYARLDRETGEIVEVVPEYCTMSRRPAIAQNYIDNFFSDVYPSDEVILQGRSQRPPVFYDKRLKRVDRSLYDELKARRVLRGLDFASDCTPERLAVREAVALSKSGLLKRCI